MSSPPTDDELSWSPAHVDWWAVAAALLLAALVRLGLLVVPW